MSSLKVGDKFPSGVTFDWAPILDEDPSACGLPQTYDASKNFAGKKTVLVSVPGKLPVVSYTTSLISV